MFTGRVRAEDELRPFAVPLKPRPYRHTVGLRPTTRWLLPGPDTAAQVAVKGRLLVTRGAELVGVLDDPNAARVTMQAAAAVASAGGVVVGDTGPRGEKGVTGRSGVGAAHGALAHVASSISEDICVMSRHCGQWQLVGAAVFFPSHWSPVGKLGGGLDAIHAPVPGYPRIAGATEQAFERLAAAPGVWERFNWTLTPDSELCHTASADGGVGVTAPPGSVAELWLRVERQTLTALNPDLIVFLIRTFLTPLPELTKAESLALAEAMSGVSEELAEYRSWFGYRDVVSRWVQSL